VTGTVVDFKTFRNARIARALERGMSASGDLRGMSASGDFWSEKHSIGLPAKWQRIREERAKARDLMRERELIQFAKSGGPTTNEPIP
jgi:hypothetical protein